MNRLSYKKIIPLLALGITMLPHVVLASSLYITTSHSEFYEGDTILFNVRIDSEGKNINTVEGTILFDYATEAVSLVDINTADSVISLWPNKPLPSDRNIRVSFAGGSPGGFISDDAVIFNVVLKLLSSGPVALSPENIAVYLNDGKGTKDEVRVTDLVMNVLPRVPGREAADDWSSTIVNDTTPPEPFEVYGDQEDSVFDGKKFLSFSTVDLQSGISHYEVTEGDLPPVRSNETYILQEQATPTTVVVRAYDSSGNVRESVYTPPATSTTSNLLTLTIVGVAVFLILLAILVVIFRKLRKAQK